MLGNVHEGESEREEVMNHEVATGTLHSSSMLMPTIDEVYSLENCSVSILPRVLLLSGIKT